MAAQGQEYLGGSFFVGLVLAILFGFLASNSEANRTAYIFAAAASGLAGLVGGIIFLARR